MRTRLIGSPGLSAALSGNPWLCPASKTVPARAADGDRRPDGDIDLELGGDKVDAYKDAAEGFDLRNGRPDSERGNVVDSAPGEEYLVLGIFIVDAAAGRAWIGVVGVSSLSG